MRTLTGGLLGVALLLATEAAQADIKYCNNTANPIWTVAGYVFLGDYLNCTNHFDGADIEWEGWYYIPAHDCLSVYNGCFIQAFDFTPPYSQLYYYADDFQGHEWGFSGFPYLTSNSAFDWCTNTNDTIDACNTYCPEPPYGEVNAGFTAWSTNPWPLSTCDFTLNFN